MKIIARLLLFLIIVSQPRIYGQQISSPRTMTKASLSMGYGMWERAGLEAFAPGADPLSGDVFLLGLRSLGQQNHFVFGYDFFGVLGASADKDSLRLSASGGFFSLGAGYILAEKNNWQFYPMLHAGVAFTGVAITEDRDLNLQQIQNNPGREINLYRAGFMLDLSLNFDLTPKWKVQENSDGYTSLLTGLSLGYLLDFANDNWRHTGGRVTGAPRYGMEGFYIKLSIGVASTDRLKKSTP